MFSKLSYPLYILVALLFTAGISVSAPQSLERKQIGNGVCRPPPLLDGGIMPSTGRVVGTALFVDFPDAPATESTQTLFDFLEPGSSDFYKTISFGKLELEIRPQLQNFFQMPANSDTYYWSNGGVDHGKYINDALEAAGTAVDFSGSSILYIIPTRAAKAISNSPTYMGPVTAADGTVIGNSVTFGQDLYDAWGFLVLNHETGHAMGLYDLYPFGGPTDEYVGGFNLMGLISGQSPDYFAAHKWNLKWIDDNQVACVTQPGATTHRISPVEIASPGTKLVMLPIDDNVSLLAEVRSTLGGNGSACGVGVLLYTSDTSIATGQGPMRVIDSRPNSGGCDSSRGGELNDAPFGVGGSYTEPRSGIKVTVTGQEGDDYIVEVMRP